MSVKIGINGFGRIGRNLLRAALDDREIDFVAVNDLTDPKTLAHLLKYDSLLGICPAEIHHGDDNIVVNGKSIRVLKEKNPEAIDWTKFGAQMVIESTGKFTKGEDARKHIRGTVNKVIVTAPGTNVDHTIVLGVNEGTYDPQKHHVVSNASCTTNCLAPVAKVLNDHFKVSSGFMVTIHSYTNDQVTLDFPHKDLRRARAAAVSIIPTSTGAAKAIGVVIPELKGKMDGIAMRVPTPNVSVIDLVCGLEKQTSATEVNEAMRAAAAGPMKGILQYCEEELVSVDFRANPHSSILDAGYTKMVGDRLVHVMSWYDNEWGYSCRVRDLIRFIVGHK
ncbi:MAG: type I glyceraldehyde-3-phosphate dehydrogenase [Acidobacteriia bacterium]|nr:type I glyceraldehyde-3-phosphate dehydrogenase [Terriglobia bacterium]